MATLKEKIGYGFGDMSSSMFWKIFSYYLPFFYLTISCANAVPPSFTAAQKAVC